MSTCSPGKLLRTLAAFSALAAGAAFGQDGCRTGYICFERGEAKLESTEDIAGFITTHHEKLGLTGKETLRCSEHRYLDRPPNYAYVCQQPFVQGVSAKYLSLRVDFWSRDGDVSSVRCRCVREDVQLPRPTVGRRQAEERGLRYFYARFPEVPQASIEVIDSQDPVVQWDFSRNGFRLARNVRYRFPLPIHQPFSTSTQAEVTVSVDALDESVLRAVGQGLYIFRPLVPETVFEDLYATLASMPFGEERWDVAQRFHAFRTLGEAEAAYIERRLESGARWEPDSLGRFHAYFALPTSAAQLAAFLDDHDLLMLNAGFQYMDGGQLRTGNVPAQMGSGDALAAAIREAFELALATARTAISTERSESAQGPRQITGLTGPAEFSISHVELVMRHADALALYESELGKRLLTLSTIDQLAMDVGLDTF